MDDIFEVMSKLAYINRDYNVKMINEYSSKFRWKIYEASHNPVLISAIASVKQRFETILILPIATDTKESRDFIDLCLYQHYQLYYALKRHDGEKAKNIMIQHFKTDLE